MTGKDASAAEGTALICSVSHVVWANSYPVKSSDVDATSALVLESEVSIESLGCAEP